MDLLTNVQIEKKFYHFLKSFKSQQSRLDFQYKRRILDRVRQGKYCLDVDLGHLKAQNAILFEKFVEDPQKFLPLFENGAKMFMDEELKDSRPEESETNEILIQRDLVEKKNFQLLFHWNRNTPMQIRSLDSRHVGQLVCVTGIVIVASRTTSKVTKANIQCIICNHETSIHIKRGISMIPMPKNCTTQDCSGYYICRPDKSDFVDQQTMKLQERPEDVPTGEIPRSLMLSCDRYLVERASPGTRITVVGIYSTFKNTGRTKSSSVAYPYLQVLGLKLDHSGIRSMTEFNPEEVEQYKEFSRECKKNGTSCYERISANIDPAIWGHEDIKKAIAVQLFSGTRKELPDGIRRRGDINILLLGDPSTAKSQLLKYVQEVAPIGVYTSGKGSSAAGLTASVIKEPGTGEFYLEGGSMVLADGGIVCIDEFDKMRVQDRVAIHEAMEQQTISIAKAGITTVLNSRTSILAAANPIFGTYDDSKSPEEQIDFQTTILSRFDMIFIVRDIKSKQRDMEISRHIINLHIRGSSTTKKTGDLSVDFIKKYVSFCRQKCRPRLTSEASQVLEDFYVQERAKTIKRQDIIPITVRQLEALIRITEALAKMELQKEAGKEHAEEAIRLFTVSTIQARSTGAQSQFNSYQLIQIEDQIRKRLPLGSSTNYAHIVGSLSQMGRNISQKLIEQAILVMVRRKELKFSQRRRCVTRVR